MSNWTFPPSPLFFWNVFISVKVSPCVTSPLLMSRVVSCFLVLIVVLVTLSSHGVVAWKKVGGKNGFGGSVSRNVTAPSIGGGYQSWFYQNAFLQFQVPVTQANQILPSPSQCQIILTAPQFSTLVISEISANLKLLTQDALTDSTSSRILAVGLVLESYNSQTPTFNLQIPAQQPTPLPLIVDPQSVIYADTFSSSCDRDAWVFRYSSLNDPLLSKIYMSGGDRLLLCTSSITNDPLPLTTKGWSVSGTVNYIVAYP